MHTRLLLVQALDRWEERLEALFEGRPYDELDATLTDTLSQFPVDIQPFRCVQGNDSMLRAVDSGHACCVACNKLAVAVAVEVWQNLESMCRTGSHVC